MSHSIRLLREWGVREKTCESRAPFYKRLAEGLYTKPVKLGRTSAWPEHEIDAILTARIAGATDNEVAALVARLHRDRTAAGQGLQRERPAAAFSGTTR